MIFALIFFRFTQEQKKKQTMFKQKCKVYCCKSCNMLKNQINKNTRLELNFDRYRVQYVVLRVLKWNEKIKNNRTDFLELCSICSYFLWMMNRIRDFFRLWWIRWCDVSDKNWYLKDAALLSEIEQSICIPSWNYGIVIYILLIAIKKMYWFYCLVVWIDVVITYLVGDPKNST